MSEISEELDSALEESQAVEVKKDKKQKSPRAADPFTALENKIKGLLTEIITLRKIREEQFTTISELRGENFRINKELKFLKGDPKK